MYVFNPNIQETEVGGSLWVQGQPGLQVPSQAVLQSEIPSPKQNILTKTDEEVT